MRAAVLVCPDSSNGEDGRVTASNSTREVALVTGGSSGIGRASAVALAQAGWNLVLVARSPVSLAEAAAECTAAGAQVEVVPTDVGEQADVDAAFAAATDRFGRVSAVVNAAAALSYGRFEDVPAEVFDRVMVTNLLGTANVARASFAHFRQHGGGHLVLIGSLLGKIAVPYMSSYVTSKWAVHGLARTLHIEARQIPGVSVSMVSPGSVNTPAYSQAGSYAGFEGRPPPPVDPVEKMARAVLRCLEKPTRERSVGLANHLVVLGFRMLPAVYDALVTPLMKVGGLSRRAVPANSGNVLEPLPAGDAQHGVWGFLGRRTDSSSGPARPPGTATGTTSGDPTGKA